MSLDSVTEKIAHFIGTFDLTIEQSRLRDQYDEFTAARRKLELEELEDPFSITIKADLELDPGRYDPLPYKFNTPPTDPDLQPQPDGPLAKTVIAVEPLPPAESILPDSEIPAAPVFNLIILQPQIVTDLIGSAVTYTFQSLFLRDNDTVGTGDFRDADFLMALSEAAAQLASTLHAFDAPSFSLTDYLSVEYVESLAEAMLSPITADIEGVTIHQFYGEDAMGIIVNGEVVDEAPEWEDLLPAHHQPDETEEDDSPDPYPAEWSERNETEFGEGHTVIAGGNLAINEMAATIAWVDAPYIAVGGQAISLTMISQVAVVSDWDQGTPGTGSGTDVIQSAEITVEQNAAPWLNGSGNGQPTALTVDWITGDLLVANFVNQEIDATDIDHIQTDISASTTLYALGDNQLTDVTNIVQLGSFYDLILIEGNMISVDMLYQTLVLQDDDVVTGGLSSPAGMADENLLMNQAVVKTEGEDTEGVLNNVMADAIALDGMDTAGLEDALLSDPMFAGMEQMRVLKIDGDLLQANIVKQVTKLADQDDVHLTGPHAAATEVIAGSNALLNAAGITKAGIDSTVMAADGSYSDLLLHQASLVDAPDTPDNPEMPNEAIALLMQEADFPGNEQGIGPNGNDLTPSEMASSDDGLQTMLA